jgi:putative alpha-1,2-mannosidase
MSHASASKTLEFAYNDYCASVVAGGSGFHEDKQRYITRSGKWAELWDTSVESEGFKGFIQAKDSAGRFVAIDPNMPGTNPFSLFFYEGDSWTYSFYAPHQMPRLIEMHGGKDTFVRRLEYYVTNRIEISNEPCFLTPFLFHYCGHPDLTSFHARQTAAHFTRQNYPGDEDSGAMSSWFIFSRLGFFPVAGQDLYLLFGPRYRKVTIQMENGKEIVIYGKNSSESNVYVASAILNGKALKKSWLRHGDIRNGCTLKFSMSPSASEWGKKDTPPSPFYK